MIACVIRNVNHVECFGSGTFPLGLVVSEISPEDLEILPRVSGAQRQHLKSAVCSCINMTNIVPTTFSQV